jgi:two-component system NtrC family sensor kinase
VTELHRLVVAQVAKATQASGELDPVRLCELMSCCYEEMELNRRRVDRANKLMQEELTQMTDDLERLVEELRVRNVTLLAEITERKQLESQLVQAQKLESIGQLAAGIAHEINTPIQYVGDSVEFLRSAVGSIDGVLEQYRQELHALSETVSTGGMMDRLRAAEEAAELDFLRSEMPRAFERSLDGVVRVAKIVRAMKEFSFPDAHEHCYANINQALETTLIVAHNEYKLLASIDAQYGELPEVKCNIGELNQVFLNLIVNAAHAVQDSGKDAVEGMIAIRTSVNGDLVEIAIADNGCGIAPDNANKIFDPFFTTKEVGRGTGQGLSIARATVVTRHGGTLSFETCVGRGTTFFVRLPVHGLQSHGERRDGVACA